MSQPSSMLVGWRTVLALLDHDGPWSCWSAHHSTKSSRTASHCSSPSRLAWSSYSVS